MIQEIQSIVQNFLIEYNFKYLDSRKLGAFENNEYYEKIKDFFSIKIQDSII